MQSKNIDSKTIFENFRSLFNSEVRETHCLFWLHSANVVTSLEVIGEGLINRLLYRV